MQHILAGLFIKQIQQSLAGFLMIIIHLSVYNDKCIKDKIITVCNIEDFTVLFITHCIK